MSRVFFSAIYARDENGLIGLNGKLPWKCPDDLSWFQSHTRGKVVIMGRRTWESLPPLPDRFKIVVSRQPLDPKRHMFRMMLDEPYFSQIKRGEKTIEGRLSTPERSHIQTGDTILFTKSSDSKDTFVQSVATVRQYPSFHDMLSKENLASVLPGVVSVEEGVQVYRRFYSASAESAAGVLAIQLAPQPPASQLFLESAHNNTTFRTHSLTNSLLLAQLLLIKTADTTTTTTTTTQTMAQTATTATTNTPTSANQDVKELDGRENMGDIFVIGGTELLNEAFEHPGLERILETQIPARSYVEGGARAVFDKPIPSDFIEIYRQVHERSVTFPNTVSSSSSSSSNDVSATMRILVRRRPGAEQAYLNLLSKVMTTGVKEVDRTGVGTVSTFGEMFRCDLQDGFPMLTTKRVFWKGVVEELLWFLRGETNIAKLHEAGVHFWDGNLNSAHTKSLKLPVRESWDRFMDDNGERLALMVPFVPMVVWFQESTKSSG